MSPISKTASPGYALTPGQVAEVLAQACPATEQWDRFNHYPWGVLAHCAHVHGLGTFENGIEKPRACLTRATQIPPEKCKPINLGYRDPAGIRVEDFANREDEGILLVPKAGGEVVPAEPSARLGKRRLSFKKLWRLSMNLPGHRIVAWLGKAALQTHALQTLRDRRASPNRAKRLECVRFIGAFRLARDGQRFMVPVHAHKRKEAFHEPTHSRAALPGLLTGQLN